MSHVDLQSSDLWATHSIYVKNQSQTDRYRIRSPCTSFLPLFKTSNVTAVTEVRSASFGLMLHAQHMFADTWSPLVSVITTLWCCDNFSLPSVASRVFFMLCVYSKFGHHPHPLGYLCAKFRFFCGLHCRASPWRKIVYSINQSPCLFDASSTKACALIGTRRETTRQKYTHNNHTSCSL